MHDTYCIMACFHYNMQLQPRFGFNRFQAAVAHLRAAISMSTLSRTGEAIQRGLSRRRVEAYYACWSKASGVGDCGTAAQSISTPPTIDSEYDRYPHKRPGLLGDDRNSKCRLGNTVRRDMMNSSFANSLYMHTCRWIFILFKPGKNFTVLSEKICESPQTINVLQYCRLAVELGPTNNQIFQTMEFGISFLCKDSFIMFWNWWLGT